LVVAIYSWHRNITKYEHIQNNIHVSKNCRLTLHSIVFKGQSKHFIPF